MFFASDNWAGAHPAISAALTSQAGGYEPPYGNGALDKAVTEKFCELFEREVSVFFVATGTAANSLSLVSVNRPGGVTFCHRESHVLEDECGAPEYLMGGSRLFGIDGAEGRMEPAALEAAVRRFAEGSVHTGRPMAISLTQATEVGSVYSLDAIAEIGGIAGAYGIPLHMDGARFANALVSLDASPAEMTWKRGVDILSFGGTKNGCWCAEAVVFFDPARAADFGFIRKRAAQLFSKSRFVAAQFDAYFRDGLWLETARHANAMAQQLAGHIDAAQALRLAWKPQANEVFAIMPDGLFQALQEQGARFYDWPAPHGFEDIAPGQTLCRFVASFATTAEDVDAFGALIG